MAKKRKHENDSELDTSDDESYEVVHGTRFRNIDEIGGLKFWPDINLADIIVIADRNEPKRCYPVYRESIDFKKGTVKAPLVGVNEKDVDDCVTQLIEDRVLSNTTNYIFKGKNVKRNWKEVPLKAVFTDCGMYTQGFCLSDC